jgi:sugar (pentulose or hexulose) kinase
MTTRNYLVFDIGASGGRAVVACFDGSRFNADVTHRFDNRPVRAGGTLYWDVLRLFSEIGIGIQRTLRAYPEIASVGIDTWATDHAFIDAGGRLLANPVHYRDERRHVLSQELFRILPAWELFQLSGIFIMSIWGVFNFYALKVDRAPELARAHRFLMMPDLFAWLLTGEVTNEYSNATTTVACNQVTRRWEPKVLDGLGIPRGIFSAPVMAGTRIGCINQRVRGELECPPIPVIAPATHDTASAVAGIPVVEADRSWAFVSLGTWGVVGMETEAPIISREVFDSGFGNEGGAGGRSFLAVNVTGLWIVQQCRERWCKDDGAEISWDDIVQASLAAEPFRSLIDVDDPVFSAPQADMPGVIAGYCRKRGEAPPSSRGETARCAYESLVLKLRSRLEQLERLSGRKIEVLHLVGGGTRNLLLCQWIADASGKEVIAGPVETTVAGNLIMQMKATGEIADLVQGRQIVARSADLNRYAPMGGGQWGGAWGRFEREK